MLVTGCEERNWNRKPRELSLFDLKGARSVMFRQLGIRPDTELGIIKEVPPETLKQNDIEQNVFIAEIDLDQVFRQTKLGKAIAELPKLEINTDSSEDIINISTGVFSPLVGFLYNNDLENVIKEKRLSDDTPWTIPILFDFDKQELIGIKEGDSILLTNRENGVIALLDIDEIYTYNKKSLISRQGF